MKIFFLLTTLIGPWMKNHLIVIESFVEEYCYRTMLYGSSSVVDQLITLTLLSQQIMSFCLQVLMI